MPDAWKQYVDLLEQFTIEEEVRPDLVVRGLAWDRSVEFTLIETDYTKDEFDLTRRRYHSTTRNVKTMRELAKALLEACDFVEETNPVWAGLNVGVCTACKQEVKKDDFSWYDPNTTGYYCERGRHHWHEVATKETAA